ncbi:hypothetical protein RRG08_030630 [Elysia crispata]|uniref:F5/8 type C domain-containing protein n=1 Tax=Elysia crispata TaxID=231223 RepID=A0AAE0Y3K5_9GAST|nr:hypothetical protein RRG08_030630 [Elysia crispata]
MNFVNRRNFPGGWLLLLLVSVPTSTDGKPCPSLTPPLDGVLKCQAVTGKLQCMATCYQDHVFDTQEPVVLRNCDHVTGHWQEGDFLPVCAGRCEVSLLSRPVSDLLLPVFTSSSDGDSTNGLALSQRALLETRTSWRPTQDNLAQYLQVEFNSTARVNGVIIRGDLYEDYVTAFRVLFSQDGHRWYPYTDGQEADKIFPGNTDSVDQAVRTFQCPHEARFVRINPVVWRGHIAMSIDLIGCPVEPASRRCEPLQPPRGGAVNCEINGDRMLCTAYCLGDASFTGGDPVLSRTCYENIGQFGGEDFPDCVGESSVTPPRVNVSGFCMEQEIDCEQIDNGDYQYCGDCHYFSTCSHGFLYIRACPALLKFDSINGLCDYHSTTCQSKHRRFWLAERRMNTYWDKVT